MSISNEFELAGMKRVSDVVATTLRLMREYAEVGMSTKELDQFGADLLGIFGARSAPYRTYGFPGHTCISVNREIAHGIPSEATVLRDGDLVNIDVSAELGGFWSDNGGSFVLGEDVHRHSSLVDASKSILRKAIYAIKEGVKISLIGRLIENEARKKGYKVIRNLAGHGVGRSLHEDPDDILNYENRRNRKKFKRNSVVAIETFIATDSTMAVEKQDGWTMVGNYGGFAAQHEHTIIITDDRPVILTESNHIWA